MLVAGAARLLQKARDKDQALTFMVIDEVELTDRGVGGLTVDEYRQAVTH